MKVFMDDERKCPIGWTLTRTVAATIELLKEGRVEELSLDHDMAEEHYSGDYSKAPTGYDVVLWMENEAETNGFKLPRVITVHSMNPSGRAKMEAAIEHMRKREQEREADGK